MGLGGKGEAVVLVWKGFGCGGSGVVGVEGLLGGS